MNIDITTTATIRPDLLYNTLRYFVERMFWEKKNYRMIINIDPIGEDKSPMDVVAVAKSFFDNIVFNIADEPNFAQAVKWCWKNTESEYIFHLEDDWHPHKKIKISDLTGIMDKNLNLISLRLGKNIIKKIDKISKKNGFIKYRKIVLNPSLFRGNFIRGIASKMNIENNPERQLRTAFKLYRHEEKYTGIYCGCGVGRYVNHTGRAWEKQSNFKKRKGSNFLTWENRS